MASSSAGGGSDQTNNSYTKVGYTQLVSTNGFLFLIGDNSMDYISGVVTNTPQGGNPTTTYAGWSKDKKAFDKRCGVSKWTLHDLRRTFATRIAELGVLPHVVERLLNHRLGAISNKTQSIVTDVAEVYNLAIFLPEMRAAVVVWENKLTSLLRLSKAA